MKKLKYRILSIVVTSVLLIPTIVLADFKSDIIASCSAYQQELDKKEINACKLYIDGFIDSSLLTKDGAVKPQATRRDMRPSGARMRHLRSKVR